MFGYKSDEQGSIHVLPNGRWDGESVALLADDHPLGGVFVTETDVAGDGSGLIVGTDTRQEPLRAGAWHLTEDGEVRRLAEYDGRTVLDVELHRPTGELLVLAANGDEWGGRRDTWVLSLAVTHDLTAFSELTRFGSRTELTSVAFWQGGLYWGTAEGEVWRAVGY